MKTKFFLSPPLANIERRLFGVSDALIELVRNGAVSARIAAAVRNSPEWQAAQAGAADELDDSMLPAAPAVPVPPSIEALFRNRTAARQAFKAPAPGQIVQMRRIVTPEEGQLDWIMQAPLHALLDCPAESPDVWHGWLMSSETDYASWWDFVLQEEDGPFDPEAAMVQVWNPVRVYLRMVDSVAGQLSMARLQAVRALAAEYATSDMPPTPAPWPGRVAQRATLGNLGVVTGSPVHAADDPRRRYQQMYFHAAQAVREPARLALAAMAQAPERSSLRQRLVSIAQQQLGLLVVPRLAQAMSAQTEGGDEPDLLWPGIARVRIRRLDGQMGEIEVFALSAEPVVGRLLQEGVLVAKATALPGQSAVLSWDSGAGTALVLAAGAHGELTLPVPE